jgi:hypothetical protein
MTRDTLVARLNGVSAVLVTPFADQSGEVDERVAEELARRCDSAGVHVGSSKLHEQVVQSGAELAYRRLVADWQRTNPRVVRARHRGAHLSRPSKRQAARQETAAPPAL